MSKKYVQAHENMSPQKKDCLQNKLMWKKKITFQFFFLWVFLSEHFIINFTVSVFTAEIQDFIFLAQC